MFFKKSTFISTILFLYLFIVLSVMHDLRSVQNQSDYWSYLWGFLLFFVLQCVSNHFILWVVRKLWKIATFLIFTWLNIKTEREAWDELFPTGVIESGCNKQDADWLSHITSSMTNINVCDMQLWKVDLVVVPILHLIMWPPPPSGSSHLISSHMTSPLLSTL